MKKRVLSLTLSLVLCLGLAVPSLAAEGTEVTTEDELRAALTNGGNILLGADIAVDGGIAPWGDPRGACTVVVSSCSNLDLNGHKLNIYSDSTLPGIIVKPGETLTISDSQYSETVPGNGELHVHGKVAIRTSGATLIINSGVVVAEAHFGAGIGGTNDQPGYHDGGTITINGGTVTATGGEYCAGIGGGGPTKGSGGDITINGGTVTAIAGSCAAGIGGGWHGQSGTITINGGTVRATGYHDHYYDGPAIGAGSDVEAVTNGSVQINGGTVELSLGGIKSKYISLKNCTVSGEGAGNYKGNYDSIGYSTGELIAEANNPGPATTPSKPTSIVDPAHIAYPSYQTVMVNGEKFTFYCYALKDESGNDTNYIRLRDLANILRCTEARFDVGWDNGVMITTGQLYVNNGTEHRTPFRDQRSYRDATASTLIDGNVVNLTAFTLTDDNGGGYTYYKLRDLGAALDFTVDWSAEQGVYILTKDYDGSDGWMRQAMNRYIDWVFYSHSDDDPIVWAQYAETSHMTTQEALDAGEIIIGDGDDEFGHLGGY